MRLYAILTAQHCRRPWFETAEWLLRGGADTVQLREKELSDAELLRRAKGLRQLTDSYNALLIVNDRPDVAILCGAHGVHLGQDDLPVEEVRRLAGSDCLVGASIHSLEQLHDAEAKGVDYVGVGPAFPTTTKGYDRGKGLAFLAEMCRAASVPTVAIGGITVDTAAEVARSGAMAVAACQALCGADDPEAAAREMHRRFCQAQKD